MIFSYLVSFVIDYFEEAGQLNVAFAISAVAIFLLTVWHTLTLWKTPEKELPVDTKVHNFKEAAKTVFSNKRVLKVLVCASLYYIVNNAVIASYGTYITNKPENFGLGLSMTLVAVISIMVSVTRALVSRPMGKFADKYSFKNSSILCYSLLAVSLAVNVFATPKNGLVFYIIYSLIHAVSMAGINSTIINLLYEEVEPEQRMCAYAVQQSIAGGIGFVSAIFAGIFVDWVQTDPSGTLLELYAQQWLSIFGVILSVAVVLFIIFCMKKKQLAEKAEERTEE